jgi:hypothetical protein
LTTLEEQDFLSKATNARDLSNSGMSRKEMINNISFITQCSNLKTCENHFDYLIRENKLPDCKNGGRVLTAQKTTTKRSQVTIEQQLRWHTPIDHCKQRMAELNGDGYLNLKAHFWGNLDESGVLANEGVIRVIGAKERRKHEVAVDDNRESLSTVRIGSSAGDEGPLFVLAKGKKLDSPALVQQMKEMSPPHSRIIMTPSAYMTDTAWLDLVPDLCKGIRAMPVVCQHPDWWFTLLFDGFGSHLGTEALKIFAEYKIQCAKEEGYSSDTNQAYDQLVAKADKWILRESLDPKLVKDRWDHKPKGDDWPCDPQFISGSLKDLG